MSVTAPTFNTPMASGSSSSNSSSGSSGSSGASGSSGSSGSSSSSTSKSQIGLTSNQFLSLLATQLKSQDPLNPTDPNQFTTEMVQYATLSEQIDSNTNLTTMSNTMSSILTQVQQLSTAMGVPQSQSSDSSSSSSSSSSSPSS